MHKVNSKLATLLAAMSLVFMSGGTAMADDIELFIAGEDNSAGTDAARPNILFILDTSGSMRTEVLTQEDWNPDIDFNGCYDPDRIYWSTSPTQPGCGTSRYFAETRNRCEASYSSLRNLGEWSGNALAWRQRWSAAQSRWVTLSTRNRNRDVECADDRGVHGDNAGGSDVYAADGSAGPWSSNDNAEPAWVQNYYFFNGNYLNWLQSDGTVSSRRIDIVKDVTNQLLENLNDVNVGLMRFNFDDGGPVIHAMEDIATAREDIQDAVDGLPADGWTPLSETLYEAGQYFAGRSVEYGDGFTVDSVAESRVGGTMTSRTYNSPIDFACQKNYIVLLSDGEPTQDRGAENAIEALPGFQSTVGPACARMPGTGNDDGKCLDEMADYMYNSDLASGLYGQQNVTTYTIGFAIDLPLLASTAARGGGEYFTADDTTTLSSALTKIVVSILDDASTFTAPSVPVNAFNRTQNLDDIFVSLFNPSSSVHWPGNLKKYTLKNGQFVDANDQLAVNPESGFFFETAQSFWSDAPDGDRPTDGGAANQIPSYELGSGGRNLFTNVAGGDLSAVANSVRVENSALTGNLLGGALEADAATYDDGLNLTERERIIWWMRGADLKDDDDDGDILDNRNSMGDPLHVKPVPVIYGGSSDTPDMVVFTATNDGYLHAIDADTGEELWAFVPERLLGRMRALYENAVTPTKTYGIDGEIVPIILNDDKRGGITGDERVVLVFGMRRGGDAYFAIDVTDRNSPELLWEIDSTTPGFGALGQTWSTAQRSRVRLGSTVRDVIFVGGGYDPGQDNDSYREDNQGNAVYMIDVETGERLWSAGRDSSHDLVLEDMDHSIPAPLRVVDLNGDDLATRLYFGDMGGKVWRIDIIQGRSADEMAEGGVIASLGGAAVESPTTADLRRFYNQADVVDVPNYGERFLAVNIGSGYRAHPLDRAIDEHFFSIRDFAAGRVIATEDYPEPALFDDMETIGEVADGGEYGIDMSSATKGWKLPLDAASGEKVLSRSVTFEGVVYFTSFAPGGGANACTAVPGQNRFYAISLLNGRSDLTNEEPYMDLAQGGIAPQAELIYVPPEGGSNEAGSEEQLGELATCVGTECVSLGFTDPMSRSYWTQDGAQ